MYSPIKLNLRWFTESHRATAIHYKMAKKNIAIEASQGAIHRPPSIKIPLHSRPGHLIAPPTANATRPSPLSLSARPAGQFSPMVRGCVRPPRALRVYRLHYRRSSPRAICARQVISRRLGERTVRRRGYLIGRYALMGGIER